MRKKCIREYIFVFATLYSRYESYSSLGVFVPALELTDLNHHPVSDAVGATVPVSEVVTNNTSRSYTVSVNSR